MNLFKKTFFLVLFLATGFGGFAQKENTNTLPNAIKEMAAFNIYETTCTVGFSNSASSQYQRFILNYLFGNNRRFNYFGNDP